MEGEGIEWFGRVDGPLSMRMLIQPTIAAFFGYRDGSKDAALGAPPFIWNLSRAPKAGRRELIADAWAGIGKVFIIAIVLDAVFQYLVAGTVIIAGSIVVAVILAIVPYLFLRGMTNRWKSAR